MSAVVLTPTLGACTCDTLNIVTMINQGTTATVVTLPDATVVGAGATRFIVPQGTGTLTVKAQTGQTLNRTTTAASVTSLFIAISDGSNWYGK